MWLALFPWLRDCRNCSRNYSQASKSFGSWILNSATSVAGYSATLGSVPILAALCGKAGMDGMKMKKMIHMQTLATTTSGHTWQENMTMELEDKYFVLKYEDIETILTTEEQAQLFRMARMIRFIRIERGKKDNKYVVINQDEPYFPEVLKLMEKNELDKAQCLACALGYYQRPDHV